MSAPGRGVSVDERYQALLDGTPLWGAHLRDPKPTKGSRKRTHCPSGHAYTKANTYVNPRGAQECMECRRAKSRAYKDRLRARGQKPNSGIRRPTGAPRIVTCPDCGATRTLLHAPKTGLCSSCGAIAAVGTGKRILCPCGVLFYVGGKRLPAAKFCSIACRVRFGNPEWAEAYRTERKGEGNPNFRHGRRTDVHLSGWSVRHKGEKCCRNCGSRDRLHLHHIIPRSKLRAGRAELLNGMALCFACHSGWHGKRVPIYRDLFTPDEWTWLTSQKLTGQLVVPWLEDNYPIRPQEAAA